MTLLLHLIFFFGMQAPAPPPVPAPGPAPAVAPVPRVVVGLVDGQQLLVQEPQFAGFIETRADTAQLKYRQDTFHGEFDVRFVSRVDFTEYQPGQPFQLAVTLKNGQKVQVLSEGPKFLTVTGKTDVGTVTIKHPDPIFSPVKITTKSPNRRRDLRITYLEFQ